MAFTEKERQRAIQDKVQELSMANYEGKLKGVLIVTVDTDNVFRILQAYTNHEAFAINAGVDLAKMGLLQAFANVAQPEERE